jgi:hypothetical protein
MTWRKINSGRSLYPIRGWRGLVLLAMVVGFAIVWRAKTSTSSEESARRLDEATALIHVGDGLPFESPLNREQFERYRDQQAKLITSPVVCERAVAQPGMTDLPVLHDRPDRVQWLQDHLEAIGNEQLISVRLPGADPQQAAEIVNAVVNTYLDVALQMEMEQVQRTATFLTAEIDRKQKQWEQQQAQLATLLKFTHANPQTRQLAAERYSSLCGEAAKVHELRLDSELRMAAANVQSQQAESDATQSAKAKLDQSIAEAQHKLLDQAADEIKTSLTAIEQEVDHKIESSIETEWARLNVDVLTASLKELLIRREKLTASGGSRITVMRRATSPK